MDDLIELIRVQCHELAPRPTSMECRVTPVAGIRAVLFDVYGTMMISASGDIGSDAGDHKQQAFSELTAQYGLELRVSAGRAIDELEQAIRAEHARLRDEGVDYPEVEIREIWRETLARVATNSEVVEQHVDRFSVDFETRVNPTWPMPELGETLAGLREANVVLGIISNAQFFTPLLFPALVGESLTELGFDPELGYFSYEHRRAKPSIYLYEMAAKQLETRGIQASDVLYVGNDMLNDVTAAAAVGFRTALFAGDARSLRLRSEDERVSGVEADFIVTALPQLLPVCVSS